MVTCATLAAAIPARAQRGGGGGFGGGGGRGANPAAPAPAQRPGNQPSDESRPDEPLVFRGGVTVVQVDAYVTDASGRPATNLTADDFEVTEGGKRRTISSFAAVNIPIDPPVGLPGDDAVPTDTATNARPPSRTYLFALDEVAPDRALRARNIMRRFIDQYMGPDDVAAIALTGRGLPSSGQDFTSNRRLLLNAIERFTGGFGSTDPDNPTPSRAGSDAVQVAASLRKLTEFLATMSGRKTLIYIGEGLGDIDVFNLLDYKGGALTPAGYDAHAAIAAATRGNVTIYPIDPRGLTTEMTAAESFSTAILDNKVDLGALAEATGGFAFTSSNSYGAAFERIVRETSSYYTIGFNSEYQRRDGRFVPIDVRVKRPGYTVRARAGYVAPIGQEKRPARVAGDTRLPAVADAIASPVATSGVPLRVVATPFRAGRDASVALVVEMDISTLTLEKKAGALTADVEVEYLATDAKGKVHPGKRHAAHLTLKPEAAARGNRNGVRLISEFEIPDGRYQIRVAAGSAVLAGSVVYDLDVPDFGKGALTMSGISLTSVAATQVTTVRPSNTLGDVMLGPPTAVREFSRSDVVAYFAEVYDNGRDRTKAASPIEVTAELRDQQGQVVASARDRREATPARKSGGIGIGAQMPLRDIPPGRYVLHVEARVDRDGSPSVSRDVAIVVF